MHGLTPACVKCEQICSVEIRGSSRNCRFLGEDRYSSQLHSPYWFRHFKMAEVFLEDYLNCTIAGFSNLNWNISDDFSGHDTFLRENQKKFGNAVNRILKTTT